MSIAALITWILAAGVGLFMLIRWATSGGVRKVEVRGPTSFQPGSSRISDWPRRTHPVDRLPRDRQPSAGLDRVRGSPPDCAARRTACRIWAKDGRAASGRHQGRSRSCRAAHSAPTCGVTRSLCYQHCRSGVLRRTRCRAGSIAALTEPAVDAYFFASPVSTR